jgi:TonB family protein
MKTTPEFTDAEIHDVMDFKQVLALTEVAHRRRMKVFRRIVTAVLITGMVGGGFFVYQRYTLSESSAPFQTPASTDPLSSVPLDTAQQAAIHDQVVDSKKPAQKPTMAKREKETTPRIRVDSVKSVFLPAVPTDGYPALYDYFAKELRYPQQSIKDSIQGVIFVSFVINPRGTPEHIETDHLLGEAFEREAIRLIEHMPAWKPALLDGSPVSSKISVPITFTVKTLRQQ